jgi:hypothetical protein
MGISSEFANRLVTPRVSSCIFQGLDGGMAGLMNQSLRSEQAQSDKLYTWRGGGSRLVILFKVSKRKTMIYDPATECIFTATPAASLGPACKIGTTFLAQVIIDKIEVPPGHHPEPLICSPPTSPVATDEYRQRNPFPYDEDWQASSSAAGLELQEEAPAHTYGLTILLMEPLWIENESMQGLPAKHRYALLRDMEGVEKQIITSTFMRVQWAGDLHALQQFVTTQEGSLPHVVDCLIQLGKTDPLDIKLLKAGDPEDDDDDDEGHESMQFSLDDLP